MIFKKAHDVYFRKNVLFEKIINIYIKSFISIYNTIFTKNFL